MLLTLLIFIVVVGLLVYVLSLLPIPEPFAKIVQILAVVIVVVACLQVLFGVNLLGSLRAVGR